jgi:ribosomal-protein-serine acetyltransferase
VKWKREIEGELMDNLIPSFTALRDDTITLHLITPDNLAMLLEKVQHYEEAEYFTHEVSTHYVPRYDAKGRRNRWGFYATMENEIVGFSLLGVNSWEDKRGYTGADTLPHQRGKRIAPASKPHLFYLAFHLLGLNRIETGCFARNESSRRSIEKTPGFVFEGVLRQFAWDSVTGRFEDELRYSILRGEWATLYDTEAIEIIS